ncbi:MAG: DNA replication/repair protein RecF [Thermoflexaceae bacterium]|nr:DNA replication/repair protein RecF [Thermoflexaceae bacterium]
MKINSLDLKNFRNYDILNISFDEETNIIYGDNAQGKTNILEAIYVAATTKSHRGSKDREMIAFHEEESHIKAIVQKKETSYRIDMHLKKNKPKGIAINGVPIRRASELFGIINIVFFSPEDLNIIKDGPAARRRFIDMELSQIDKIYLNDISNYNRILIQRNKLLKEIGFRDDVKDTLDVWDMQLNNFGLRIIERRKTFIKDLNEIINGIHHNLSGGKENLVIEYEPNVDSSDFERQIFLSRERDIKTKMTNIGPHKDDICFKINGNDVRKYGSQGQQRTAALSLKLSEISLVKRVIHDNPILLLDDVLSELDSNRQNYLLNSIKDIQTIITCTGLDEFINNRFEVNKIYKVIDGTVSMEN